MLKNQLELLKTELTNLKDKITAKLQTKDQAITEGNRKVETLTKENSENEKVLETLLKEMKELAQTLA